MKLSEKTIELNICAQISKSVRQKVLWFGLTQVQEARAGFDAATSLNGRVILFQFKASDTTMRSTGARRFMFEHSQLQKLINRSGQRRRHVFYVLPMIGTTQELHSNNGNFISQTWLLDVAGLPTPFPPPTIRNSSRVRANYTHYADVLTVGRGATITIHSEPVEAKLIPLSEAVKYNFLPFEDVNMLSDFDGGRYGREEIESDIKHLLNPGLQMAVLYH